MAAAHRLQRAPPSQDVADCPPVECTSCHRSGDKTAQRRSMSRQADKIDGWSWQDCLLQVCVLLQEAAGTWQVRSASLKGTQVAESTTAQRWQEVVCVITTRQELPTAFLDFPSPHSHVTHLHPSDHMDPGHCQRPNRSPLPWHHAARHSRWKGSDGATRCTAVRSCPLRLTEARQCGPNHAAPRVEVVTRFSAGECDSKR